MSTQKRLRVATYIDAEDGDVSSELSDAMGTPTPRKHRGGFGNDGGDGSRGGMVGEDKLAAQRERQKRYRARKKAEREAAAAAEKHKENISEVRGASRRLHLTFPEPAFADLQCESDGIEALPNDTENISETNLSYPSTSRMPLVEMQVHNNAPALKLLSVATQNQPEVGDPSNDIIDNDIEAISNVEPDLFDERVTEAASNSNKFKNIFELFLRHFRNVFFS